MNRDDVDALAANVAALRMVLSAEETAQAVARFRAMGKHIGKRARKLQRRIPPLIKRLERARAELEGKVDT